MQIKIVEVTITCWFLTIFKTKKASIEIRLKIDSTKRFPEEQEHRVEYLNFLFA